MRNIFSIISIAAMVALAACQKTSALDPVVNTNLDEASTFSDSARSMDFMFRIYSDIGFAFGYRRYTYTSNISAGTAEGSDEAVHRLNGSTQPFVYLYNGTLNAIDNEPYRWMWQKPYENIRRSNVFLSHLNGIPISPALKLQTMGEVRFLRAWYYSILLKNFGGIPLIGDRVYTAEEIIDPPRSSYEECVDYIIKECDTAAALLPLAYGSQDYGRITKGACMGLKSRVLLYAASPLFNGGGVPYATAEQKPLIGYSTADPSRWQRAAQAAKEIIDMNMYSLYEDNTTAPGYGFSRVFLMRKNNEYLLPGMQGPNKTLESFALPTSRGVNPTQTAPSQNLAEAFGMNNGKALTDPTSGFNPQNPFVNRDPRFTYTFIYNGTPWYSSTTGTKIPVNIFYTLTNGVLTPASDATLVWLPGYYWRKMMDDNTANNGGNNTERCLPLIRYAEILLNYAEASNEAGNTSIAYDQLKIIRKRAGIIAGANGLYGLKDNMTQAEMRSVLQTEREVELAWEDHRYWDVRRWKIADATQNVDMKALQIVKSGSTTTYNVIPININIHHTFKDPYYLFPIMQTELGKNPKLIQNPGY